VAATFSTCTNSSVATAAPSDPLTLRAGENEDACPDPLRRRARGGAASGWDAAAFPLLRCGALAIIPGCLGSPPSYRAKRGCGWDAGGNTTEKRASIDSSAWVLCYPVFCVTPPLATVASATERHILYCRQRRDRRLAGWQWSTWAKPRTATYSPPRPPGLSECGGSQCCKCRDWTISVNKSTFKYDERTA